MDVVEQLPNHKSPGSSKIPNEFWKHADPDMLDQLHKLLNKCVEKANTPTEWKKAIIVLISKCDDWKGDLTNMKPITLIETACKILTKILSNRISNTCSTHQILKGDNFSVLKDTSTSTPIQIVNATIEFSNQHKKPLCIVTQDMNKAHDSVGITQLIKAMERIHIHPDYIKL